MCTDTNDNEEVDSDCLLPNRSPSSFGPPTKFNKGDRKFYKLGRFYLQLFLL